jgi:hypothetical protein
MSFENNICDCKHNNESGEYYEYNKCPICKDYISKQKVREAWNKLRNTTKSTGEAIYEFEKEILL